MKHMTHAYRIVQGADTLNIFPVPCLYIIFGTELFSNSSLSAVRADDPDGRIPGIKLDGLPTLRAGCFGGALCRGG